jgi:hypothetical protein
MAFGLTTQEKKVLGFILLMLILGGIMEWVHSRWPSPQTPAGPSSQR